MEIPKSYEMGITLDRPVKRGLPGVASPARPKRNLLLPQPKAAGSTLLVCDSEPKVDNGTLLAAPMTTTRAQNPRKH